VDDEITEEEIAAKLALKKKAEEKDKEK